MKKTISDIAQLLKSSKEEKKDSMFYAKVNSLITEGGEVKGYKVSLDGTANDTIEAKKIAGAKVGDVVQVNLHNGHASVTGTVGGDTDARDAQETAEVADGKADAAQETAEVADGKATTAQERADSAYEEAQTAIQSADSKSTVYHQPSQPSGGTYKTGDTWFDTDDGYKMYTYNGSSWVAEQFNTNAIANSCITNAKIADATIQNAKIATLDAGKITTGTLDANRIAANSLTIGKMASDVTTSISNASTAYQQCVVIDGNGVKVRNSSYPNNAIRMASDGIEFYKDGQSVAYYTDTSIELGKNNNTSVIKLCGGTAQIKYGMDTQRIQLANVADTLSYDIDLHQGRLELSGTTNVEGGLTIGDVTVPVYSDFAVTTAVKSFTSSFADGAQITGTVTSTKSGYYPLAVAGVQISGYHMAVNAYLSSRSDGSATVTINGSANGGVTANNSVTVHILWVKM